MTTYSCNKKIIFNFFTQFLKFYKKIFIFFIFLKINLVKKNKNIIYYK